MTLNFAPNVTAQQLADILPNGVAILNYRYELISINRRFRRLVPCASANFSECWLKSVHSDDYERVTAEFQEGASSKQPLRIEYHSHNPESMWCVMTLEPLNKEDVKCFGRRGDTLFICTIADITPEKKAELMQRQAAREAQDRKKQQERFIDIISHEIRNPLSAILHCTEDIQEAIYNTKREDISLPTITEAVETISLCITHQKKIVNDVLTFSKLDASMLSLNPHKVQPKRHLTTPLSMFRPELRKQRIKFEYEVDVSYGNCGIDWVMADLDRMGQVLINILSNAIKFTARSGNERLLRVSMGASIERPSSYPPNIVFFDSGEAGLRKDATNTSEWGGGESVYIMVAVKDSGIGISDQAQKRLFERFNQATPRTESIYGGSGLGLNVCRQLCHLHGGEIGVSSREARGSTFGFFFKARRTPHAPDEGHDTSNAFALDQLSSDIQMLGNEMNGVNESTDEPDIPENPPVANVAEVEVGAPDDKRTSHTQRIAREVSDGQLNREHDKSPVSLDLENGGSGERVLLVEDNFINRRIISRKLGARGFAITEACNGQQALEMSRNTSFDCILMDQQMPIMDGNAATKAIREIEEETGGHVPVLGVTANAREAQQEEMMSAGMDDIIHKPYGTQELVQKIKHLVNPKTKE
ncbi:uncharacterized protein N7511_005852 [Penicillium nucicola]|uniref:uncharacterized protein n=1 Tax=Penicillium nucicola TaxID=1850975 RepID=UPI00254515C6|nr:uncharacterized protein N7511_005852 [Penicillium nucicola]KAJ5762470.1 hypothetical protein N7511_005852 [Penicillium nucicola]